MIDVARAQLPEGNISEYQIGRGMSAAVLDAFGLSGPQFVELVRHATNDEDVAKHLWRTATAPPTQLGRRLQRLTVADVPLELQSEFHRLYGGDLSGNRLVFDVIDEDDARMFAREEA